MNKPQTNGHSNNLVTPRDNSVETQASRSNGTSLGALIAEAQSLRDVLVEAYSRCNRLLVAVKRQRKQPRLMQTTLARAK